MKTLLLILLPALSFGQTIYKGGVINKKTKEKVPFATVALIRANTGTNADEVGQFILTTNGNKSLDTLIISCVGYETLIMPANKLPQTIELDEKQTMLSNVSVASKLKWTSVKLHDRGCGDIGVTTNGFQTQIAQIFTTPFDNVILAEVEICKSNLLFDTHKTLFRVRFYDMDTITKAPSVEICDEVIEVNTSSKKIKVNLEKYKIRVPHNFFVAIEWLKIPYNEDKETVTMNGKKQERITYRPTITCDDALHHGKPMERAMPPYDVWGLNYQNKWFPMTWIKNLSVSATVKY